MDELEMAKRDSNSDYSVQVVGAATSKVGDEARGRGLFLITQLVLRTLVVGLTLAAIITTVTARQTASFLSIVIEARYSYSSSLRFQVGANAVVCAFCSASVMLLLYGLSRRELEDPRNYFRLLLHDMVMTMLLLSGCAAASAVGYLARNGQKQGSWEPFCDYVDKFCDRAVLALAFSYSAFFCMCLLTLIAAYKLMSLTQPTPQHPL